MHVSVTGVSLNIEMTLTFIQAVKNLNNLKRNILWFTCGLC